MQDDLTFARPTVRRDESPPIWDLAASILPIVVSACICGVVTFAVPLAIMIHILSLWQLITL